MESLEQKFLFKNIQIVKPDVNYVAKKNSVGLSDGNV